MYESQNYNGYSPHVTVMQGRHRSGKKTVEFEMENEELKMWLTGSVTTAGSGECGL